MCLDKGYDFAEVRRTLDEFGFTAHIRSRGEEAQAIKREAGFKARRWVVERTHSWLNVSGASWFVGTSPPRTTSPFFISPAPSSPSEPPGYRIGTKRNGSTRVSSSTWKASLSS